MKTILVLLFIFLFFPESFAKDHPYSIETIRDLEAIDINEMRVRIERKIEEITALIGDDKKAEKSDSIIALKLALKTLDASGDKYRNLTKALELEGAVRIQGDISPVREYTQQLRNVLKRWTLPYLSVSSDEASDLSDGNGFLSADEMAGKDLSLFDPDPAGPFWRDPKGVSFYEGIDLSFPSENVVEFDEMKFSDTKPKMNVFVKDESGKKKKYKLKVGAEIHADPTLAQILTKLGFPTDHTKFVRDIRVNLGKTKLKDLIREWESYYRRDALRAYKIENYIKESGDGYVVFKEALLEAKPSTLNRVGGWSFGEFGHLSSRALRGLTLIQLWLDNSDIKEFGNNRVILNGENSFNIISDLGKALGGLIGEKPELLNPKMVSGISKSGLTFTYRGTQSNTIKNKFTFADARWAGRLMATLSRKDIEKSVAAGGWPTCVAKIYTERLVSRRNDFLTHVKLMGEKDRNGNVIAEIPVRGSFELNGNCSENEISGGTVDFDFSTGIMMAPILRSLRSALSDLTTNAVNQSRHITISDAELGWEAGVISQVILDLRREVQRNPSPKSFEDQFIVKDHFEAGFRLGFAFGLYKDFVYTRSFTLAYPVRSLEEARYNNGFIVNVLLPRDIKEGKLPEKYVLHTDHFFERGVGIEADDMAHPVSPTVRIRASKARIMRSILDHRKKDEIILYRDRTDYAELYLRAFVKAGLLKLPVLSTFNRWGQASGAGMILTGDEVKSAEVRRAVIDGDFSGLTERESSFALRNNFRQQEFNWNFVFWRGSNTGRFERISVDVDGDVKELTQYRTTRNRSWSLLGNSEKRATSVEVIADAKDYQLTVSTLTLDSNTTDDEMEKEYLAFINGLSTNGERIIPFTPSLGYSTNQRWGKIEARSETTYYGKAIALLLNTTDETYWNTLAVHLNSNRKVLDDVRARVKEAEEEMRSTSIASRSSILKAYRLNGGDFDLIRKAEDFIRNLRKVQRISGVPLKLKKLGGLFRAISQDRKDARLLGTINRLVGEENYFSINVVAPPQFSEVNMIEGIPLVGERGKAHPDHHGYLNYVPETPLELWNVFQNWRVKP